MGTNYYVALDVCPHCGRGDDRLHIGKASAGWAFALNTHPEHGITSLAGWKRFWRGKLILNEYGERVTSTEMLRVISRRSHPRGLQRSPVDGRLCLAHGRGTWDIIRGEFS